MWQKLGERPLDRIVAKATVNAMFSDFFPPKGRNAYS
jgi:hypothetical protein